MGSLLVDCFAVMNTNTALVMIIACSGSLGHVLDHLVHEHLAAAAGAGSRRHAHLGTRKFTQPAQTGSQHLAVPDNAAASLIEVTNAVPQESHDQAWSMRPRRLNRDSSANSKTLPQSGHFGRPDLRSQGPVVTYFGTRIVRSSSMPPRCSLTAPNQSPGMLRIAYGAAATPS